MAPPLTALEAGQLAMVQIFLVAVGAGAAAALLFASVASGSLIATLLFYLASLPILIAAMGWSHVAGLLGALLVWLLVRPGLPWPARVGGIFGLLAAALLSLLHDIHGPPILVGGLLSLGFVIRDRKC